MIELKTVREVQDYCDEIVSRLRKKDRYLYVTVDKLSGTIGMMAWSKRPSYINHLWKTGLCHFTSIFDGHVKVSDNVDFSECIFEVDNG